jgi:Na+/H+ antiporter NhaD/arsenite permease-like protein
VIKSVDWGTIMFFTTMFITKKAIRDSGVLYTPLKALSPLNTDPLANTLQVALASLLFSQLLSNVPLVELYIDYLHTLGNTHLGNRKWIALAMSSAIAENLTLPGVASNIILEAVESRYR